MGASSSGRVGRSRQRGLPGESHDKAAVRREREEEPWETREVDWVKLGPRIKVLGHDVDIVVYLPKSALNEKPNTVCERTPGCAPCTLQRWLADAVARAA